MPFFKLDTNISEDKVTPQFLESISKVVAATLGKPESYVCVHVTTNQLMLFGGNDAPCANATLMSIGQLGIEQNKKHAKAIYDHVKKHLNIPEDRFYIQFIDSLPSTVGYNGSTFHPMLGNK